MWSFLILLFILFSNAAAIELPRCIGFRRISPELDAACRKLKTKADCFTKNSLESPNIQESCYWRVFTKDRIVYDTQISTKATSIISEYYNRGTVIGTLTNVTLSKTAGDRWGVSNRWFTGLPDVVTTAVCLAGLWNPKTCKTNFIAPKGYALVAPFVDQRHNIVLTLQDPKLIKEVQDTGYLTNAATFALKYIKLRSPPQLPDTPIVVSETILGNNVVSDGGYLLSTYQVFNIANVSGAVWKAQVGRSLESKGTKTNITTFLMLESVYLEWIDECTTTCKPPTERAVKNTPVCSGLFCKGEVKGLNANERYVLFVSYPEITSLDAIEANSESTPLKTDFARQTLKVEVIQKVYALDPEEFGGTGKSAVGRSFSFDDDVEFKTPFVAADL